MGYLFLHTLPCPDMVGILNLVHCGAAAMWPLATITVET